MSRYSVGTLTQAASPNPNPNPRPHSSPDPEPTQALYAHALRLLPATPNVYASLASLATSPQEAAALSRVAVRLHVMQQTQLMQPTQLTRPASAAQSAQWPRPAEARGSLERDVALSTREASGWPAASAARWLSPRPDAEG